MAAGGLFFVIVLVGATIFDTDVERVPSLHPQPVIHQRDSQLTIDRLQPGTARAPAGVIARVVALIAGDAEGDIGRNLSVHHSGKGGSLADVELVIDLADPSDARRHYKVRRDRVVVIQQKYAAQRRLVFHAVQRIGLDDHW